MDPEVNLLLVLSAGYFAFSHMTLRLNIALHGKDNIADFLSRLPVENLQNGSDDIDAYIKFVASAATPGALTTRAIEEASHEDPELQQIWTAIQKNRRADAPHPYQQIWDELTAVGRIVLRGCRIVVPTTLRRRILMLAHEGHQGIVNCKDRLRTKVWWPGIDTAMERLRRECHCCQATSFPHHPPPMSPTELPSDPWLRIAADLLGTVRRVHSRGRGLLQSFL